MSLKTYGTLSTNASSLEKSINRLSSGTRIAGAADDAAGLAISEKLRRQVRGLSRAKLNAQDGVSMIQTAEGALNESHSILQRMRELAAQSANDTLTSNDRLEIQKEVVQLRDELNRIAFNTEFNTKRLLDGSQTALVSSSSRAVQGYANGSEFFGSGEYDVSIALLAGGVSQMSRSQIFTVNDGSGKLADGQTQLQSIAQFYDENGVFALDSAQSLVLHGNGRETSLNLDGQMTLNDLAAGLQSALVSGSGLDMKNSSAGVVNTVQTQIAGQGGYLSLIAGSVGDQGRFSFAADQKVLDAIGFSVQREAVNSRVEVNVRDSFGNTSRARLAGNRAGNLLEGVDLNFSSQAAQIAGFRGLEQGLKFTSDQTFSISVNSTQVDINIDDGGANGWTMEGIARSINDQISAAGGPALGVSAAVVDGEIRIAYDKPASVAATVSSAIVIASATTGASSIGLLDGSFSGFVVGQKDQTKAVWGFSSYAASSKYGIAGGTDITFDLSDGSVTDTITLMTTIGSSNATVADMVQMTTFMADVNSGLTATENRIRVDRIGSSMAFTSLRVGNENRSNTAAMTSMVSLSNLVAGAQQMLLDRFGLAEGTAKGSGDTNFVMRVIDRQSQFQIGADQGQAMRLNIANVSAAALGVENLDLTTSRGAGEAMGRLNRAIDTVSSERSKLGAYQNRLEHTISNLDSMFSNMTSSESRIRDADIALEMIEFTKLQILNQSGTAMLAQANMITRGVLDLLGS
jgi:flagellin